MHINEPYVNISIDDFEDMRIRIVNTGRPIVQNAFTKYELINYLNNHSGIKQISDSIYTVDMSCFLDEQMEEELDFFEGDVSNAKKSILFCNLSLNHSILYDETLLSALNGASLIKGKTMRKHYK